eukprot:1351571-Amorphochlora_amoeboformis.AAC.1
MNLQDMTKFIIFKAVKYLLRDPKNPTIRVRFEVQGEEQVQQRKFLRQREQNIEICKYYKPAPGIFDGLTINLASPKTPISTQRRIVLDCIALSTLLARPTAPERKIAPS